MGQLVSATRPMGIVARARHVQDLPICGNAHAHEQLPRLLPHAQLGFCWGGRPSRNRCGMGLCLRSGRQGGSLAVRVAI